MASVVLTENPLPTLGPQDDGGIGSQLYPNEPKAGAASEPVSPFVLPARDLSPTTVSHPQTNLAARRGSRNSTTPPLPAFSFNPGAAIASSDSDTSPSPTKSTHSDTARHPRGAAGHRRRGSEFNFHDDNRSSVSLPTPSPLKAEYPLPPPPPVSGLGPPSGRRGHAHRRSGAISGSDMSSIIKSSAMAKHGPGSAPSTPSELSNLTFFGSDTPKAPVSPSVLSPENVSTPPASPSRRESAPGSIPRPRVGFREDVEFIPRPLSLISSETSSSKSTVRGSHSLSGSVVSLCQSPPQTRSSESASSPVEDGGAQARPRTADAASPSSTTVCNLDSPSAVPGVPQRPASSHLSGNCRPGFTTASGSPMKRKHFWSSETNTNEVSPKTTPVVEKHDPTDLSLPTFLPSAAAGTARPRTSPERKLPTKPRKVRTWAGSILTRKGKHRTSKVKGRRTSTPPLLTRPTTDSIFDNDDTVVIRDGPSPALKRERASEPTLQPRPLSWQPDYQHEHGDDGAQIDLDAALGYNDSVSSSPVKSGFAGARARLHSGGGRGSFDGYGNYHRRTESAPELAPFDRPKFPIHRLGSNSSMGDVFEEEEDDYLAGKQPGSKDTATSSDAESSGSREEVTQEQSERLHASLVPAIETPPGEATSSAPTPADFTHPSVPAVLDNVEIVEGEDDFAEPGARSSDSTITPPLLQDADAKRPASSPVDFAYAARSGGYASSEDTRPSFPNSTVSSPDPDHISFDPHARLHPHSNDPMYAGSLRPSVDDIPSLTSSASTMTNAVPRFSSSAGTRPSTDQRSASFSVPYSMNANRAKRASLASLSKLISGSGVERSKLRYGETPPSEDCEERNKKKGRRISRLLQFWRTKEKDYD